MINEEGGVDPEQFRMEAMFDRMDAVGKAVLGLTIQCAQCHTHKYDPLTQTEYYQMFAFLNNSHEASVTVYTDDELEQCNVVLGRVADVEAKLKAESPDWKQQVVAGQRRSRPTAGLDRVVGAHVGDNGQRYYVQPDHSILAAGYAPTELRRLYNDHRFAGDP